MSNDDTSDSALPDHASSDEPTVDEATTEEETAGEVTGSDEPSANEPSADEPSADELAAYDLDGDGKISFIESERGTLGIVDAHLEQLAERDGITGKLAEAAHKLVDRIDND